MKKFLLTAALGLAALAAQSANATLIDVTFSAGPLTDGSHAYGVNVGDSVSGSFVYDDVSNSVVSIDYSLPLKVYALSDVTNFYNNGPNNVLLILKGSAVGTNNTLSVYEPANPANYVFCNGCVTSTFRPLVADSSVPEAGTWAMFTGGFGLVGAMVRRRKTSVRFA